MTTIEKLYNAFVTGSTICTDTRKINSGSLFFALKGENFNGNVFAKQALDADAVYVVVDEAPGFSDSRLLLVDDVLTTLQQLATHHRRQMNIPFIGITGSNGKTTTKELVSRVLSQKFKTLYTQGNLNNHIGVPLTLLSVTNQHQAAVIEMGANHQKEIELLCAIALPTHVLITNVGKAHLEGFGGFEGVKKGKGEMYQFARNHNAVVFINDDNSYLKEMLGNYSNTFRYGKEESADVAGKISGNKTYVSIDWKSKSSTDWKHIDSQMTGEYNFENILSAVAVGDYFGIDPMKICEAIASYIPDNQRSQEIKRGDVHIILDAYNANPTSMEAAITNFDIHFKGKRAVFLGDMFELGTTSLQEHQHIIQLLAAKNFDTVILVGPNFKEAGGSFPAHYFATSSDAAAWMKQQNFSGYNILIKGSRGSKMEVVLAEIK